MSHSSQVGARFEQATLKLFLELLPRLGFDVVDSEIRRSGTQKGFDLLFRARGQVSTLVPINFFVECKGAASISQLQVEEFEGKPDQLVNSRFNPDYWILFSPLRYLSNELQENLQYWRRQYPFALLTWVRDAKDEDRAGPYLDLFKFFPQIYEMFQDDIPENIRNQSPETTLEEILQSLQSSIKNAYDEFEDRVVIKGLFPGVRRITPQSVLQGRETDTSRLNRIRRGYYMLNSSDRFVWKVVCNDVDVRNIKLTQDIEQSVQTATNPIESFWILGAPGCGKTTQMNRSAVDFAMNDYPIIAINALELDEKTKAVEYEEYLKKIYAIHNGGSRDGESKRLLVFIDNPTARLETIVRLLDRFDGLEEDFSCVFLLYEREVRYHQAEDDSFLPSFVGGDNKNIYVDHRAAEFKHAVFESFVEALVLPTTEREIAEEAFMKTAELSIAEAVINFCKRTNNEEYRRFAMDWVDFDEVIEQRKLDSLSDLYKLISIIYQFGIALPISMLPRLLPGFNENQFLDFQDFFTTNVYDNLPVIIEGKVLRARHELISQWHVQEKLASSIRGRLEVLLRIADMDDALERSVLTTLLGRKQIVRRYFTSVAKSDLNALREKAAGYPLTQRILMMMEGWSHVVNRKYHAARDVFRQVMVENPRFLPPILEAAKMEFVLRNSLEAETLLEKLLILDPQDLHARTELAKVYQVQKRYGDAERVLKECIAISRDDLNSRTELAKVYQVQKRYAEAERVLKECLTISKDDLNSRTELAKVYQMQKRYDEAKKILDELLTLEPADLQARTELAKVYQVQKRYDEAKKILDELLTLEPADLQARTELAKIYQVQKRYGEAEQVLKESLEIDLNQLHPRTELARVYQMQKRYEEAEQVLKEVIELDPENLQARTELARVYQVQKRYEEAERVLKESLEINPNQLHPRTELAKVYQVRKKYGEAEQVLKECIAISENDLNSRTELARVYQVQRRYEEAEQVLKQLIVLDPENLQARTELARTYIRQGLFRRARAVVRNFLEAHSHANVEEIAHLILTYLNACYLMKRYSDGVALVDKLESQLVSAELSEEYGRLLRSYDLAIAVRFFQTAIAKFRDASRLLSEAAICFKLAGVNNAETVLEQAIRLLPDKETKYRHFFDTAGSPRLIEFAGQDYSGTVEKIYEKYDLENRRVFEGTITDGSHSYSFWSNRYGDELFSNLQANSAVLFDVTARGTAINVEPMFHA